MSNFQRDSGRGAAAIVTLLLADYAGGLLAAGLSGLCAHGLMAWLANDPGFLMQARMTAYLALSAGFFACATGYFFQSGHYSLRAPWWLQVGNILTASVAGFLVTELIVYGWRSPGLLVWNGLFWLFVPVLLFFSRWIARGLLRRGKRWNIPTVLIGGPQNVAKTISALRSESYLVYDLKRVILPEVPADGIEAFRNLHREIDVRSTLSGFGVRGDYVVFCPDDVNSERDRQIVARIAESEVRFAYVPPLEGYFLYNAEMHRFFGHGIVALEPAASRSSGPGFFFKSALDKVGALVALAFFAPFLFAIARAVKKDGGPALYGHRRVGKDGRPFKCWKFRSMVMNSQEILKDLLEKDPAARAEYERDFKLKDDPRVTKIGKFLRKTSLDEIPQLFNVLRGEMSLMGPRPIVEDERKFYETQIDDYTSVKPGMTGLWQVSGRSDTGYARRVYLDIWYIKNWSFWNDIIIIFKTVLVVVMRKGAY